MILLNANHNTIIIMCESRLPTPLTECWKMFLL